MKDPARGKSEIIGRLTRVTGQALFTIIGVIVGLNILVILAPGDAIDSLSNSDIIRDQLAKDWGLDQPVLQRITQQVWRCLQLDFGASLVVHPGESVATLMKGPGVRSSVLVIAALVLGTSAGGLLAFASAMRGFGRRHLSWIHILSVPPLFLTGALCIDGINNLTWRAMESGWIERPSFFALPLEGSALPFILALLVLAFGSGTLSETHLALHRLIQDIDTSPYVMASRAQGRTVSPHFIGNAIIPIASLSAKRLPLLIGSLVILDPVFNLNGIGRLFWRAAEARDFPVLVGVGIISVAFIVFARWSVQVLEFTLDPRRHRDPHAH